MTCCSTRDTPIPSFSFVSLDDVGVEEFAVFLQYNDWPEPSDRSKMTSMDNDVDLEGYESISDSESAGSPNSTLITANTISISSRTSMNPLYKRDYKRCSTSRVQPSSKSTFLATYLHPVKFSAPRSLSCLVRYHSRFVLELRTGEH